MRVFYSSEINKFFVLKEILTFKFQRNKTQLPLLSVHFLKFCRTLVYKNHRLNN